MRTEPGFDGAKLALLIGPDVVTLLRDDVAHIPWPGHWDFPGGAREGDESPEACVLRETREELGLTLSSERLVWKRRYENAEARPVWFFTAHVVRAEVEAIRLGDEGQGWSLMPVAEFLAHPKAIAPLKARLGDYLALAGA